MCPFVDEYRSSSRSLKYILNLILKKCDQIFDLVFYKIFSIQLLHLYGLLVYQTEKAVNKLRIHIQIPYEDSKID